MSGPSGVPGAPGEDRSPALALVNTARQSRSEPLDLIAGTGEAAAWLAARGLCDDTLKLNGDELEALHALRAAIRSLFVATIDQRAPDFVALATLNRVAESGPGARQLHWDDGDRHAGWMAMPGVGAVAAALAQVADDAIGVLSSGSASLLRACDAHGCTRLYLQDHGRRLWCSRTCGDRVRVARHYLRTHPHGES